MSTCVRSVHLRPRTNTFSGGIPCAFFAVAYAIHKFFQEREFCICSYTIDHRTSDCEGAGADVPSDHAGSGIIRPETRGWQHRLAAGTSLANLTNLTVSWTAAMARSLCTWPLKRFTPLGRPSVRKTATRPRHASEFWMIEPEIAFADLQDDMDFGREYVKICHPLCAGTLHRKRWNFFNRFVDKGLIGTTAEHAGKFRICTCYIYRSN